MVVRGVGRMPLCVGAVVFVIAASTSRTASTQGQSPTVDPIQILVGRLDLERYKTTIKSLTRFGDRLQGTDRNKAAIDWIAAQLEAAGCAPERLQYVYDPAPPSAAAPPAAPFVGRIPSGEVRRGLGGSRLRGVT